MPPASASRTRSLQRLALDRALRCHLAQVSDQLLAVGCGLSADPALDRCPVLRHDEARPPAETAAIGLMAVIPIPVRPVLITPRGNRPRRAEPGRAMTDTSSACAVRSTSRSIPWGTCWHCMSTRRMTRIASRLQSWQRFREAAGQLWRSRLSIRIRRHGGDRCRGSVGPPG